MPVIDFPDDRTRAKAWLHLRVRFDPTAKVAGRWSRLRVTEDMLEALIAAGIPYHVVDEAELQREADELLTGSVLYDIRERNYPNKRGDSFRSVQVFECWVCGALTNEVIMGGSPGYGVRSVCPNAIECWHHELENKIVWSRKPHPAVYKEALLQEIEDMKRQYSPSIQSDIAGSPDMSQKREMTNVRAFSDNRVCEHRLR